MRTLLVEDNEKQREEIAELLRELGHEVTPVPDADAGMVAQLKAPHDFLVIDWVMPGMDGVALCRRVRQMPGGEHPYILMVTGRNRPTDLVQVLDAGADDYIAKPLDFGLLRTRIRIAEQRIRTAVRHREAQRALAQSEIDFQRVIERSPLGMFAHDGGEILYVNEAAAKTMGVDPDEVIGRRFADFVDPEFRMAVSHRLERFEQTEVPPAPMLLELRPSDGRRAIVRVIFATRAGFKGERAGFTIIEDVTERQSAERQLRMTQFAVDHATDAAIWIGMDGAIVYANHAACKLLGHPRPSLVGRPVTELKIRDLQRDGGGSLWHRILDGDCVQHEVRLRRSDGQEMPVELSANAVEFDGERFVVAFARDLTERHQMQSKLQKADRLASVGSLAAGVAHEINNPLAYVIANLELLEESLSAGRVPEDMAQTLKEAVGGANRVRRIVGDLKSFARADEDEPTELSLDQVLDAAIEIAKNEIRHRARLERDYREVPPVLADEGRLIQVFLNLLVNAAHAIPEDETDFSRRRIVVSTKTIEGGWAQVEVTDTGRGIPDEIIDHIFDPFFTTKPQGMGTGLGLSICHGIVTGMGGKIEVESQVGRGSCFRLRFPPSEGAAKAIAQARRQERIASTDKQLRILVVDDEPLICEGIRRALAGHRVEVAGGGRDAIRMCEADDFDLILCDVMMPDISGMDVYGRIRSARPALEGRFVFMTGGAFTPKAREFLESVANEQITKPFSLRELRTLVAKRALAH